MMTLDASILLVDDGELDDVAASLDAQEIAYERAGGGTAAREIAPPRDLLIVTPRHIERVRRGSPADAAPGRPLRIVAVEDDCPAMRRRLRRSGLHLLVRLPAAAEIWRLLIARALYQGNERREAPRVAVGSRVALESGTERGAGTILVDLSNRGCRLRSAQAFSIGDSIRFRVTDAGDDWGADGEDLVLRGRVRRLVRDEAARDHTLAIVFDADLEEATRTRLAAIINRWASGPTSAERKRVAGPAIPPCQIPSIPDLTLDDETDPPIPADHPVRVQLEPAREGVADPGSPTERRSSSRGRFESSVLAESPSGPTIMIGRDLSAGGMRIERIGQFAVGDRFRVAIHGPGPLDPFVVEAEVRRDDGEAGFALAFRKVDTATARAIEKLVACLPDIESLEEGESGSIGAILSEILND
jgi:hypothetical protein